MVWLVLLGEIGPSAVELRPDFTMDKCSKDSGFVKLLASIGPVVATWARPHPSGYADRMSALPEDATNWRARGPISPP